MNAARNGVSEWSRRPIRQVVESRVSSLGAPDRLIYVVQNPKPGAALFLRLPRHATGAILDPRTAMSVAESLLVEPPRRAQRKLPLLSNLAM